ncbi:NUDIX domain-containing protein [Brachybacterium sp. DNPG3]
MNRAPSSPSPRHSAAPAAPATAAAPAPTAPPRRIVLLAGPSGSGKGELCRRSGLPTVALDEFYRDQDDPGLPRRFGIVDWDDPGSWNIGAALEALTAIAHEGVAEIPVYSIPLSRRTGTTVLEAGEAPLIIAEGIFAAELIAPLRAAGLLADAIVLERPVPLVFSLRLARDLREGRKPPLTLVRRGLGLAGDQRADAARWCRAGMRTTGLRSGVRELQALSSHAIADARIRSVGAAVQVLRITAVCFLREGADGTELLAVRKRGTGSYMQVGGKLEPGESPLEAAIREVEEEIGVRLEPADLSPVGDFEAVAANEPGIIVRSTVFRTRRALPDPLAVQAELADHCWIPLAAPGGGRRLAPLMVEHIMPALREL